MKDKFLFLLYNIIRKILYTVYPKTNLIGMENLPDEASVIVGNHAQMHGPIISELHFSAERYIWCAGEMMHLKDVPAYAYKDFWSAKPAYIRWLYKIAAYAIAPLSVLIFNRAHTIGVYHDSRILSTFKNSLKRLNEGAHLIIFPERNETHNNIVYEFQEKFVDIAKLYYKKTGKKLSFVPMYIVPNLKSLYLGKPIEYCPDTNIEEERHRICDYLMNEISNLAYAAPAHTVVPYANIPKNQYPTNNK